jgi:hypothetical protein
VPGNASAQHFQVPDPLSTDQRHHQTMIGLQRRAGELVIKCALVDGRTLLVFASFQQHLVSRRPQNAMNVLN